MAFTVTATMSGTAANEHIFLQVEVLTGAIETGGATSSGIEASGGANSSGTLTPNFSASLPVFALTMDNPGTNVFTALTNNTLWATGFDSGDDWLWGMGRYTGTVTAATPVTFGGSATSGDYGTFACYEIQPLVPGVTPVSDASSPTVASATGAGVKTVSTASFTPPAGSVLTALVSCGGTGSSGTMIMAITDTSGLGLVWTQRAGNSPVTDQSTFVVTATMPAGATVPPAARPRPMAPGWHPGRNLPGIPGGVPFLAPTQKAGAILAVAPVSGTATLAAAGSMSAGAVQQAGATLGGAGSVTTQAITPVIVGIGGTGAGYFADQNAKPRMVIGDAVWALPGNAGRWSSGAWQADFDTYFSTRGGQGFTAAYLKPIGTTQSGNLDDFGKTFDSLYPFQGGSPSTGVSGANPSSGLTAAFWARIDYMFASALAQGITIFFNAIGYDSDFNSGPGPLAGKSTTEFQAYGAAVGARYASQPNLIWNLADDYFGGNDAVITAFMTGVRGAGDTHVVSIENFPETDSRQDLSNGTATTWGAANATYNFCYSYNVTYFGIEKAFLESSPIPVIQGDGYFYQGTSTYAGGTGAFAFDRAIRQDAWHALSSGARGVIQGDEAVWQWTSTAAASVAANWYQKNNIGLIRTYLESLANWQNLIPDTSSVLVTAGRGTHATTFTSGGGGGQYEVAFTDSYVTASRCADKSLAVIYMSHGSTITIDTTQIASGFTATWVDPVSLATSSATAGSTFNSTAKGNNSQGDPDWVLVLQASTAVAGTATLAGAGSVTTAAVLDAPATLAGTGAITSGDVQGSGGTLSGTGTLAGPDIILRAGATLAGTGSLGSADVQGSGGTLGGAGSISAPDSIQQAGAALAGTGSVTGSGSAGGGGGGTLGGTGSLAAPAVQGAGATLGGAGSLTAPDATQGSGGTLGGAGTLSAPGSAQNVPAALAGTGTISDTLILSAGATLAGTASLIASAGGLITGGGTLGGAGSVSAPATQQSPATLAGTGSLTSADAIQGSPTTISGAGHIAALSILKAGATLAGTGSIQGSGGGPTKNATSKSAVTARRTSAAAVTARRTSAPSVTSKATSVPAVTGG